MCLCIMKAIIAIQLPGGTRPNFPPGKLICYNDTFIQCTACFRDMATLVEASEMFGSGINAEKK